MKERILKRFDDEIATLERELKTELPKEIQRAREFGDLRENAEYQAAKERQTYVQARIAMLQRRRNEVSLMNLDRVPHDPLVLQPLEDRRQRRIGQRPLGRQRLLHLRNGGPALLPEHAHHRQLKSRQPLHRLPLLLSQQRTIARCS